MELPLRFPLRVGGKTFDDAPTALVRDPWRGEVVGEIGVADAERADLAVHAARDAFETVRRLASFERKRVLRNVAARVESETKFFAELMAREAGKPREPARAEVKRAVLTLEFPRDPSSRCPPSTSRSTSCATSSPPRSPAAAPSY